MSTEGVDIEYMSIHVRNPRTHLEHGWPVYTDYEIVVQTNSTIFAKKRSQVRRRFSEFEWLWKQLSRHRSSTLKLPCLPTKTKIFGRYSKAFIEKRRSSLQEALASLARITPIVTDSSFHLFIQSNLKVKEMEEFINGQDTQDLVEITLPRETSDQKYRNTKARRCTCHSTGDSGFSSSIQPYEPDERTRLFDDVSNWVASQHYYTSTLMTGNGWSSGYTCLTSKKSSSDSDLPSCPQFANERSTAKDRRISLSHNVASVLPGGKLMVAPSDRTADGEPNGKNSEESKHYERDVETDIDISEFHIIKDEPFVRVREWLNSQNEIKNCKHDTSDEEENTVMCDLHENIRVKEYDIISVPCSAKPTNSVCSKSIGYHSHCEGGEIKDDAEENGSDFTFVHSSIGGVDWNDRDELSSSCDSLRSASIFLTYDVVEMIELRCNNVV